MDNKMEANETVSEPSPKRTRILSADRGRPNFFIAIQVTNPEIHKAVRVVQDLVTSKKPLFKSVVIKLITLHVTLCTLRLPGNDDIRRAKSALQRIEKSVKEALMNNPVNLKFKGIGSFKNEVVFAKIESGEPLTRMKNIHSDLLKTLIDEGLDVVDDFSPHLTMMKMSRDKSLRKKRIFKIPKDLYEDKCDLEFGDQTVRSIQLLSIGDHEENKYYNCYHLMDLGINDNTDGDHMDCCGVQSVTPSCVVELPPQETPEETPGEIKTNQGVKIIETNVGGNELFYEAVSSEDESTRDDQVILNPDLNVAESKMTELMKHEEGILMAQRTEAVGEGKEVTSTVVMVEAGQGDVGTVGTAQDKPISTNNESQGVDDIVEKTEVQSKVDVAVPEKK